MIRGFEQMAIVGPDLGFTCIQCSGQMNGIARPQKNPRYESPNQCCCSPEGRISNRYQVPEADFNVSPKEVNQFSSFGNRQRSLSNVAVKNASYFD